MFDVYHGTAAVYMTDLCRCCSDDRLRSSARDNFLVFDNCYFRGKFTAYLRTLPKPHFQRHAPMTEAYSNDEYITVYVICIVVHFFTRNFMPNSDLPISQALQDPPAI